MYYMRIFLGFIMALLFIGCGGGGGGGGDTDAPVFTSSSAQYIRENQTAVCTIKADDSSPVTYSIQGGDDQSKFSLDRISGLFRFIAAPDFEHPSDTDLNNIYKITVRATDAYDNYTEQNLTVTVSDIDEIPPHFSSASSILLKENHTSVVTLEVDNESSVNYTIAGGDDAALFFLFSGSNILRFKTNPNFESPLDLNHDNNYTLTVSATDPSGNRSEQELTVVVTDIDETVTEDSDNDRIPDNIEVLLESNLSNNDINNNGIDDGIDTEGEYGDPFFYKQWHLWDFEARFTNESDTPTQGDSGTTDLNLLDIYHTYMGYNKGDSIIVQVVDNGVDADHEDLIDNMDMSRSYYNDSVGDPSTSDTHGTMVAGIMASRALNGKGVRGIAPFARIAGSNWLNYQTATALETVWLTGVGANEITVTNNSWGTYYDTGTLYEDIMERGTSTLRDGKGRIYVFAAGNDRTSNGNANLQYMLNNRYPIVVAALKNDNTHASYSTPGANILVSGYSGDYYQTSPTISTTTVMGSSSNTGDINTQTTWAEDTAENYTFIMNGTSAASPTVAGSIALVLEACPDLTWRDIRYLAATHARRIDPDNGTWVENNASLWHSTDYGFGVINPSAMIQDCTTAGYTLLPGETSKTITKSYTTTIPDNESVSFDINMTENLTVEWVETTIDNDNPSASDYRVTLTSPAGTTTTLMTEGSRVSGGWMSGGFRLSTPAMMGENAEGNWTVTISDTSSSNTGVLYSIELKVYGH